MTGLQDRTEQLKNYIVRLNQGDSLENVQKDFQENFQDVAASEIVKAEQEMLRSGMSVQQISGLCDVHSALFHGATRQERIMNAEKEAISQLQAENHAFAAKGSVDVARPGSQELKVAKGALTLGHPLNILTRENDAILKKLDALETALGNMEPSEKIRALLDELRQSSAHFDKKDELLLPVLKRHGVSGPSDVMWNMDSEMRRENARLAKAPAAEESIKDEMAFNRDVHKLVKRMREMIFKEKNILFPLTEEKFTDQEWQDAYNDFPRFGYSFLSRDQIPVWKDAAAPEEIKPHVESAGLSGDMPADALIKLPGGQLTPVQLEGILRTLPLELTFLDSENINRYFSEDSSLFPRALSALGHSALECHPPKVQPVVKKVIESLRSGEKDCISFTAPKHGRLALVRYFAVRGRDGAFLGTLEAVEDITDVKALACQT